MLRFKVSSMLEKLFSKGKEGALPRAKPARTKAPRTKSALSPEVAQALASLDPLTTACLLILSVVSGYLNYLSLADMFAAGMALWQAKTAAATVSVAVSAAIMVFWSHMMTLVPIDQGRPKRRALFRAMMLGCGLIFLISSWMNASALVGVRAQEQDLAVQLSAYQQTFDEVLRRAIVIRQLVPSLQAEADRFTEMSKSEKTSGALTGSRSPGAVTATLDQVAGRLTSLQASIDGSLKEADEAAEVARQHLKAMQDLLRGQGEFEKRLNAFTDQAVALDALMARLSEQSVLPAIRLTAGSLGSSLILPATSAHSGALAEKQQTVMDGISGAVHGIGERLAGAAAQMEKQESLKVPAFKPLSRSDAVIAYAGDFLPAWGAAVSLDLMPLVIVLVRTIVRATPETDPKDPAPKRRKTKQETAPEAEREDFEDWLERRPGGASAEGLIP